ncbi:hypothetical protein AVEN_67236-1 [Araneus ventricosus]|uniref:Peptidase A2 domain-containing protein n=1 Tax=Araneus ventricosus TaxID=182803 RepID=A0A4Y2T6K0_ARAVE|nr:hypothetical protein AVEN_67236-1 [Araneus ventricosus]
MSSRSGGKNGLFIEAFVNEIPCRVIVDTRTNVTIMRQEFSQQLDGKILWMPPCVTLQTVTGDKIPIFGKLNVKFDSEMLLMTILYMWQKLRTITYSGWSSWRNITSYWTSRITLCFQFQKM